MRLARECEGGAGREMFEVVQEELGYLVHLFQGILDAYYFCLSQVEFYGPTNFSYFLDQTIESAMSGVTQQSQSYSILLVITVSGVVQWVWSAGVPCI